MRAIRYHGQQDVRYDDIAEPECGPGDIVLTVHYNGLCGTDLHEYFHGPFVASSTPHPLTGQTMPCVLGHELSGSVLEVGAEVSGVAVGDLVAVQPIQTCGTCPRCLNNQRNLCNLTAAHGFHRAGGGLAERTSVRPEMVHVLPAGMTAQQGAMVEPMAVSYRAVARTRAVPGDAVVVFGAGPIGIGALLALKARGIETIVSETSEVRRATARALGADYVLDPAADDITAAVFDLTAGIGAAGAIEAAGVGDALLTAVASTRPDGYVVVPATYLGPLAVPPHAMLGAEVHVTGSRIYTDADFRTVIGLMADGQYPFDGWVDTIAFDRVVEDGFAVLNDQQANKLLVDVQH